ncbi:MAG: CPBP family intramembrane metalloprotease [Acidobacteriota bacterium]|nr:CPBP family intramembrane metalloprotease [Acidobacteriota bacterium]
MEPEDQPSMPETAPAVQTLDEQHWPDSPPPSAPDEYRGLRWVFIGPGGLRAGWSVPLFTFLFILFSWFVGSALSRAHLIGRKASFTATAALFGELVPFLGMLGAAAIVALVERRRFLDYNLRGPRRVPRFFEGLAAGFLALSALVGILAWGHWLHFGPVALSGAEIVRFGALWGCAFLLVGCVEEGMFRCYLQFTLTRGINFWWALGIEALLCVILVFTGKGNGVWGVYGMAMLGVAPCWLLHQTRAQSSGFWQAAWVSSTLFGFVHTGNAGENWIGIFAAAAIGFVFCVSVWVTGSAWWAIGCHAAWDWAETFFFGTADSGTVATGHFLTTSPSGAALWSGSTDGPEGSLLVLPTILLLLVALIVLYRRESAAAPDVAAQRQGAA